MSAPLARAPLAALFALLLSLAQADAAGEPPWQDWRAAPAGGHPLVGKIWSVAEGKFIAPDELAERVGRARGLLLGEVHDNPDHHRLQAWLLARFAAAKAALGAKPVVVFEMLSMDQAARLAAYLDAPGADARGLGPAVGWSESGWPEWSEYQPIAEAALAAGLAIAPGDPRREEIFGVAKSGAGFLPEAARAALRLDEPLPAAVQAALLDELYEAHCRMAPRERLSGMADAQRFRDAHLAAQLIKAGGPFVLIAGNGHVRADAGRGAPHYLNRISGMGFSEMAVVMMAETQDGAADPASPAYAPPGSQAPLYIWFTPSPQREDPCAAFSRGRDKGRQ